LLVLKPFHDAAKLAARIMFDGRFDNLLEAFAEYFRPALQVNAKPALLRADFVS
jgi:hypothetical protein